MPIHITPSRLAALVLLFFATAHTLGGLIFTPSNGPAADAVLAAMKDVRFDFQGAECTYYGFHLGFGLMVTVFLLFSAVVAWALGDARARSHGPVRAALRPVAQALMVAQIGTAVLSWSYFHYMPGLVSTVIVGLLGWDLLTVYGI